MPLNLEVLRYQSIRDYYGKRELKFQPFGEAEILRLGAAELAVIKVALETPLA